ncbi:MAG TPA: M12 family metallo-peptidase [Bacteroidia bacterium]|nr:M12 family metallo-peptidase [Bacteroidia bacterium]HMU19316.1 M12 family metallo-peptidase [Bacteroidia bacterium]
MKGIFKTMMTALLIIQATCVLNAQDSRNFWREVSSIPVSGERLTVPSSYRALNLDLNLLQQYLNTAKPEPSQTSNLTNGLMLEVPMPDGSFERFSIFQYNIMHPDLAAKFPQIKTYTGKGINDVTSTIKLDVTQFGFHAMIRSSKGDVYIDPYNQKTVNYYMSYERKNLIRQNSFECSLADETAMEIQNTVSNTVQRTNGTQLRTYRLALACTGEYAAFYGGTVSGAMAGMATTMNRVNGVYESELSIRMVMVANNNLIVYTNSSTDPFTNNNGSTLLSQNQTTCDNIIGSSNYDIGHVFSTGGGGVAYLGCVCSSSNKAKGVTGNSAPSGDGFDIDYVAHEMGHQFGGDHTFNSTTGSCNGNRSSTAAYEPGSGITIQAYAGICGSDNLAPHSIAYFHGYSLDQMITFSNTGGGNSCPVTTSTGNTAPVVTNMGNNCSIPISTPFVLTGAATDANGDALTYSWEERDLGSAGAWNVQSTTAPMFRPFPPTTSPSRTFPQMSDVVNNTTTVGELLPNQARTLKFRLTARDSRTGGGGIMHPDTNLIVTVVNAGGAFAVTAPNTAVTWAGNSTQTVTWNVSGTTGSGINTANVKISLSTDGGYTYPTVLLATTPNDGSQTITVPNISTTTARVKVEAVGNIFFDISNINFTITTSTGLTTITTSPVSPLSFCKGTLLNVSYTVDAAANAGNIFTAQLSNSSGSFASPVNIGTLTSTTAGTINCQIPVGTATGTGYRIRVISSNPSVIGSINNSNLTVSSDPTPTISGATTFCSGSSTTLSAGAGYSAYLWSTGATTQGINVNTTGTFTVTVTNSSGCTGSATAATTANANPTPSISGNTTFCQGSSTTLSAGSGYSAYLWSNGATTSSINVSTAGTFTVTVTNASGCTGSTSATTTVNSNPTPSISGATSFCLGSSTTLSAGVGFSAYLWSNGATTSSINVSTAGIFTVTVTNASGCTGSTSATTTVNPLPVATITPSGNISTCNSSQLLNAGTGIGFNFQWRLNSNNILGATADNYTATVSGNYDVVVTLAGCSATSSQSILTLGTGSPQITANGSTNICAGSNVQLSAPAGASSYQWYRNNVALGTSVNQNYYASSAGQYYCKVTGTCSGNSNVIVVSVINNPTPTISSSTSLSFCVPGYVTLTANTFAGVNYQWQFNSVDIPGATSQIYNATQAGGYRVIETANGCVKSKSISVQKATSVTAQINTNDQTTLCSPTGTVNMALVNPIPGYSYQWQKNGVDISNATGTTYAATSSGSYSCKVSASCGTTISNAIPVSIGSFSASVLPAGTVTICTGASVVLSASTGTGFTYQWKNNGVDINGATSPTLTVNTAGSYSVYMTSPCGNATSNVVTVNSATVSAVISPSGTATICAGQVFHLSVTSNPIYTYQWYRNNVAINGAVNPSCNVTSAGTYYAIASLNGICPVTTANLVLTVINNPTPTITASGPTTICNGQNVVLSTNSWPGVVYQWTKNSVDITGETGASYTANTAGGYRVRQTGNGCSKLSPLVQVKVNPCRTAGESNVFETESTLSVFPNPVFQEATIIISSDLTVDNGSILIYDVLGNCVLKEEHLQSNALDFRNENLKPGIYFVYFTNGDGYKMTSKFIVQ